MAKQTASLLRKGLAITFVVLAGFLGGVWFTIYTVNLWADNPEGIQGLFRLNQMQYAALVLFSLFLGAVVSNLRARAEVDTGG